MNLSDLIEFLFSNLFMVVLIVGGIFSFLKRNATGANRKRQRTPRRPREIDTGNKREVIDTEHSLPDLSQEIKVKEMVEVPPVQQEKIDPIKELKLKPKVNKTYSKKSVGMNNLKASQKKVINGIIWSEILGQPRGKQSYTALKKK